MVTPKVGKIEPEVRPADERELLRDGRLGDLELGLACALEAIEEERERLRALSDRLDRRIATLAEFRRSDAIQRASLESRIDVLEAFHADGCDGDCYAERDPPGWGTA